MLPKRFLSKIRKVLPQLPYLPQTFGLVWKAAGNWTIISALLLLLLGILPAVQAYLLSGVVNSFVAVTGASTHSNKLLESWQAIALLFGIWLLSQILKNISFWVRTMQAELIQDYISGLIHDQAISLDLAFFETPDYYDQLHRATLEARTHPIALLENISELARNGITVLSMVYVLFYLKPLIALGLFISILPSVYSVFKYNQRENQWRLRNTFAQRQIDYYDTLLTSRESAAELRLFDLGSHFKRSYQIIRHRLRCERMQLIKEQNLAQLVAGVISLLIMSIATSWIIWEMSQEKLSLGDLALLAQALWIGQGGFFSLLSNVGKIYRSLLFLKDLFDFLSLKPQIVNSSLLPIPLEPQKEILFQEVTFHYPDSQHLALDRFTLKIPAKQVVAIVGENGAGKSTLIKLLCRFYDPETGSIMLDGIDLRHLPLEKLRSLITVIFQQPVSYQDTAANNIALSAIASAPTPMEIEAAAQASGADIPISKLSQGYNTLLGKWFGGEELSGGEWQRVALARAFLRQASIIMLDEPTSAMDSWAEADWLTRFRQLTVGRTVIIITHRFTTAMQADIIHVMEKGRVVESGTHHELLVRGGRYAESWEAQVNRECQNRSHYESG